LVTVRNAGPPTGRVTSPAVGDAVSDAVTPPDRRVRPQPSVPDCHGRETDLSI